MVNSGVDLAQALVQEANLRVLVLSGYFDLGSPFTVAEYMVSHLGVPKEAAARVEIKYYEAGHMMYVNTPSLEKVKHDLDAFVDSTR
jgi:carboxypeptidase C (cathepsin A)